MDGWIVSWSEGQGQGELEAESRGVLSFLPSKLTTLAAQPAPSSRSPSTPSDSQQKNASPFPPGGDLDAKQGLSTFIFTPRHHLQSHSTRFSSAHGEQACPVRQGSVDKEMKWPWALLTELLSSDLQAGQFLHLHDAGSGTTLTAQQRWMRHCRGSAGLRRREGRDASGKEGPRSGLCRMNRSLPGRSRKRMSCIPFLACPFSETLCLALLFLKSDEVKRQCLFFFLFPNHDRLVVWRRQVNL